MTLPPLDNRDKQMAEYALNGVKLYCKLYPEHLELYLARHPFPVSADDLEDTIDLDMLSERDKDWVIEELLKIDKAIRPKVPDKRLSNKPKRPNVGVGHPKGFRRPPRK